MIHYQPPKSAVWGHEIGRLSAVAIVDRGAQFLDTQCTIISTHPSELLIGWNDVPDAVVSDVQAEILRVLGQPATVVERPGVGGQRYRHECWPFSADQFRSVATWFDQLAEHRKAQDVFAQTSVAWTFAWRDEAPPLLPMQSAGGMFGIHFGDPQGITTMFSFRDFERFLRVKEYLAEIGLAELSEKHLRPKIGIDGSKKRGK